MQSPEPCTLAGRFLLGRKLYPIIEITPDIVRVVGHRRERIGEFGVGGALNQCGRLDVRVNLRLIPIAGEVAGVVFSVELHRLRQALQLGLAGSAAAFF